MFAKLQRPKINRGLILEVEISCAIHRQLQGENWRMCFKNLRFFLLNCAFIAYCFPVYACQPVTAQGLAYIVQVVLSSCILFPASAIRSGAEV